VAVSDARTIALDCRTGGGDRASSLAPMPIG
jgi:hypothetical protein